MMNVAEAVTIVHAGGFTKRYHTLPTVGVDTVASHSFGVAWLAAIICEGKPSANLLLFCLRHDLAEAAFGDIPSPAKKFLEMETKYDEMENSYLDVHGLVKPRLTPEELRIFKLADNLDGLRFCIAERNRGNLGLQFCERNYREYIEKMNPQGVERDVFNAIEKLRLKEI